MKKKENKRKSNSVYKNVNTAQLREEVQAEINSRKISIDKSEFQKTDAEKEALREAKKLYKRLSA